MKERPILFSAPMVRAILDGLKTQTRRVVKPQPSTNFMECVKYLDDERFCWTGPQRDEKGIPLPVEQWSGGWPDCSPEFYCPYGKPGDRLWGRESFQPLYLDKYADGYESGDIDYTTGKGYQINYVATDGTLEFCDMANDEEISNRIIPSIFMPRWASRINLEITDVRTQHAQDISEEDAFAEGIQGGDWLGDPCGEFAKLWDSINAKKHPWSSNPWVWVVSFRRLP